MLRLKKIININRYNRVLSTYPESWSKLAMKELGGTKVYIIFIIILLMLLILLTLSID